MTREDRIAYLETESQNRIFVLDGAMGTMIQRHKLTEEDYRGTRFADWQQDVKGNNDLLSLTRPDVIKTIHRQYLEAGADILGTNTFSSTTIAQADYAMESLAYELNYESAKLAREVADDMTLQTPEKVRLVAGAMGPTNRTGSISPDVNDPGYRNVSFDELRIAYKEAAKGLIDGGADILIVETIFDTLNAKSALFAIEELFDEQNYRVPVMISGTLTDASGRTLSGQTAEAFWNSVRHVKPFSVGLNCALGADLMRPHIAELSRVSNVRVSAYPNAGLPNEMGGYDETPGQTSAALQEWAESGFLNVVGGCCGTTPDHIEMIAKRVEGVTPRKIPDIEVKMRLSGLEPFNVAS